MKMKICRRCLEECGANIEDVEIISEADCMMRMSIEDLSRSSEYD